MKFICEKTSLAKALGLVGKTIPARPTHPILSNIKIVAFENKIEITAFDLSISFVISQEAEVIEEGTELVCYKVFSDLIAKLPSGDVSIETGDDCVISSHRSVYHVPLSDINEYPSIEDVNPTFFIDIPSQSLVEGLKLPLVSTGEETQQILTGINIKVKEDKITFASTDGKRLSVVNLTTDESFEKELEITVPAKCLLDVVKAILAFDTETIGLSMSDTRIQFDIGNATIISRLLQGAFPAYPSLIPQSFTTEFFANRKDIISSVERATVISSSMNQLIMFSVDPETRDMVISVETKDIGAGREVVQSITTGNPLELCFNAKFLLDGVKTLTSDEIVLKCNTPVSPVVIKPIDTTDVIYLVMPVQKRS